MSNPEKPSVNLYRPSFHATASAMGWKWFSVLPAAAATVALVLDPSLFATIFFWKVGWLLFAWPVGIFVKTRADLIKARREPFCIGCGYDLTTLPDHHHCPECGRAYSFAEINAYRTDPQLYAESVKRGHTPAPSSFAFDALPRKRPKARDGAS